LIIERIWKHGSRDRYGQGTVAKKRHPSGRKEPIKRRFSSHTASVALQDGRIEKLPISPKLSSVFPI
jgi:hypothetical protein